MSSVIIAISLWITLLVNILFAYKVHFFPLLFLLVMAFVIWITAIVFTSRAEKERRAQGHKGLGAVGGLAISVSVLYGILCPYFVGVAIAEVITKVSSTSRAIPAMMTTIAEASRTRQIL